MSEYYIGLMSGTSLDGIDAALVDFSHGHIRLIDFIYQPFSAELKAVIQQLSKPKTTLTLLDYGALDSRLGHLFAAAVLALLAKTELPSSAICAIGSHGQTVCHAPDNPWPFTLQIGDPNIIAEVTGITTIADFRRRDMAANGQGAPLVPAFHRAVFSHPQISRCIVNIGGIANITVLSTEPKASIIGFDTGPGNTLMDQWIQRHQPCDYDVNGRWASGGTIKPELLQRLIQDDYFKLAAPKSTGKEYFSLAWLEQQGSLVDWRPKDVQASLCELTALSISQAVQVYAPACKELLICGGGAHNDFLMTLIRQKMHCPVLSTHAYGIHPDHVEAMAFAWLARQTHNKLTGNLKEVTGANQDVILGGVYV
ncbi:MAG: anhydro-N-acetylmuramic acid kinase [Methylovulum sp.]|nr:anhydro-N-acetylmuramic acid kinase [Methylovulum sp.]